MMPLNGVRVLELAGGMPGGLAGRRLADAGAEVIKVEDSVGDVARQLGTPLPGDKSVPFVIANAGKKSIVLTRGDARSRTALARLVATVDVVIENAGCGSLAEYGTSAEQLRDTHPGLVICSITGLGERGPQAARPVSELTAQCLADIPGGLGRPGAEPVRLGSYVAAMNTAVFASQAVLAALLRQSRTGRGDHVYVDLVGSLLHARGHLRASISNPDDWGGVLRVEDEPPDHGYRTKDGRVYFLLRHVNSETFDMLLLKLGLVDYIVDPRLTRHGRDGAPPVGSPHMAAAREIWERGFSQFTTAEIMEMVKDAGGDAVPVNTLADVVAHPQVIQNNLRIIVDDPDAGPYADIAPVWRFSTSGTPASRPAPGLGQHTAEILAELGLDTPIEAL